LDPEYEKSTRRSGTLFDRARRVFAGGVNHNARYYEPYPIFIGRARGKNIWDEDGNRYTDYWMGHMALILGHSPKEVSSVLKSQVENGTHFGMGSELSVKLGEEIQSSVPCAEMIRFCNTGAEATMYLVRLARASTGKKTIIKMTGGWHGYNTELNIGVQAPFDRPEGSGILGGEQAHVVAVRFNDLEAADRAAREAKGDAAAIVVEPVLGAGGCIPADRDYLRGLREIADKTGTLLAFDEIITGFRVSLGGAQEFYRVRPDIATLGKIVGGGLPIGVVVGNKEILSLADPARRENFASIGGGTFSENPLTMAAGLATLRRLSRGGRGFYENLNRLGERLRMGVDAAMAEAGVVAHSTGLGSLFFTHFGKKPRDAEETRDEDKGRAHDYALHLMTRGIFVLPGHPGGISDAHQERDIEEFIQKSGEFAARTK